MSMGKPRQIRRSPVSRRVEALLELPDGVLGHCTRIELTDNRQALMEGCCDISEYEDDRVQVTVAGGAVRFLGQGLRLNCLTTDSVLITGKILSVEFLNE